MPKNILVLNGKNFMLNDKTGEIKKIAFLEPSKEEMQEVIAELAKHSSIILKPLDEESIN